MYYMYVAYRINGDAASAICLETSFLRNDCLEGVFHMVPNRPISIC